ncbi:hypothetical protein GYMLUDRAFT_244644 [Collybiopsis luxurians FD-317 M1]|uniref:Uncharacterized protein n=1 Tax=Collybiopsis luxurians FD-317 M1 TaxID=944289 RepID=A0A0D0CCI0_9AGAR|nr:hypothetical protein GYMLUDRAFT_244644 [Collybiopsis luxurians FD-317 M1]
MSCSAVAAIIDGAFTVEEEVNANGLALPAGADTLILTLPLLITNIFATSLIAYQAWLYRKEVGQLLSDGTVVGGLQVMKYGPASDDTHP